MNKMKQETYVAAKLIAENTQGSTQGGSKHMDKTNTMIHW